MFKKFMSLMLALVLVMSVAVIGFSAAQVEIAEDAAAADDVASQGADSDVAAQGAEADVAPSGDGVVSFDAASAGWEDASSILFYIYDLTNGSEFAAWGSKKKLGGTKGDNNIWSFDAAGLGVVAGNVYTIQFNNADTNAETYSLLMDSTCFGDTAVAEPSVLIENPVDSNKKSMKTHWTNSSLGSRLQITSIGSVVGDTIPATTTAYQMLVNFIASKDKDGLFNALSFNGKDEQTTIDDVAAALNLTQADVKKALEEAKTTGGENGDKSDYTDKWDASKSSLPAGESGGDTSSSSSSSSSSGSSSTTTTTSGSSSTTTKSGSASNTQTGQEETVLFIMLGVMVAAAGVIFFARKKERA